MQNIFAKGDTIKTNTTSSSFPSFRGIDLWNNIERTTYETYQRPVRNLFENTNELTAILQKLSNGMKLGKNFDGNSSSNSILQGCELEATVASGTRYVSVKPGLFIYNETLYDIYPSCFVASRQLEKDLSINTTAGTSHITIYFDGAIFTAIINIEETLDKSAYSGTLTDTRGIGLLGKIKDALVPLGYTTFSALQNYQLEPCFAISTATTRHILFNGTAIIDSATDSGFKFGSSVVGTLSNNTAIYWDGISRVAIKNKSVSNEKLSGMNTLTIKGNVDVDGTSPQDLTKANIINSFQMVVTDVDQTISSIKTFTNQQILDNNKKLTINGTSSGYSVNIYQNTDNNFKLERNGAIFIGYNGANTILLNSPTVVNANATFTNNITFSHITPVLSASATNASLELKPSGSGLVVVNNENGIGLLDTGTSFYQTIKSDSATNLTANRILTVGTNNGNRTLNIHTNVTMDQDVSTASNVQFNRIGVGIPNSSSYNIVMKGGTVGSNNSTNAFTFTAIQNPTNNLFVLRNTSSDKFVIDSSGTVKTGVWNGTFIARDMGGTGVNSINPHYALLGPASGAISATPSWRAVYTNDVSDIATASTGITKVGTITTGVWNGTVVTSHFGGTGVNNQGRTLTISSTNKTWGGNSQGLTTEANLVVGDTTNKGTITIKSSNISGSLIIAPGNGIAVLQNGTMGITEGKLSQFSTTTSFELAGVISDETGTGSLVFNNSPSFITPTLGNAVANSINNMIFIGGNTANKSTLNITADKSLVVKNTFTFNGTDSTTMTFPPTSQSVVGETSSHTLTNKLMSSNCTWNGVVIKEIYGGTGLSSYAKGDIVYASAINTLSKLTAKAVGNVLTSGETPSWGKVDLVNHTTGVLNIIAGGTGISSNAIPKTVLMGPSSGTANATPTWRFINSSDINDATQSSTANMVVRRDVNASFSANVISVNSIQASANISTPNIFTGGTGVNLVLAPSGNITTTKNISITGAGNLTVNGTTTTKNISATGTVNITGGLNITANTTSNNISVGNYINAGNTITGKEFATISNTTLSDINVKTFNGHTITPANTVSAIATNSAMILWKPSDSTELKKTTFSDLPSVNYGGDSSTEESLPEVSATDYKGLITPEMVKRIKTLERKTGLDVVGVKLIGKVNGKTATTSAGEITLYSSDITLYDGSDISYPSGLVKTATINNSIISLWTEKNRVAGHLPTGNVGSGTGVLIKSGTTPVWGLLTDSHINTTITKVSPVVGNSVLTRSLGATEHPVSLFTATANNAGTSLRQNNDLVYDSSSKTLTATKISDRSSRKVKKDIVPYQKSAFETIEAIDIVSFHYIDDELQEDRIGFIAEDAPDLVTGVNKDKMDLGNCVGLLLKAVQELKAENDFLKKVVRDLETKINIE
jgi:hypothetical protein